MGLVLLVRHGQASFGAEDYDVLSEVGHAQSRRLGAWLAEQGIAPDHVVRGDMRRHRETAEGMLEGAGWGSGVEEVSVDAGWNEFDHLAVVAADPDLPSGDGEPDRRTFQAVFERATTRWSSGEHEGYDETYAAFVDRVLVALHQACTLADAGRTVVVVTSGGPVAAVAAHLLDPDGALAVRSALWGRLNTVLVNTSLTRVVVGSTGARLLTFNEHPHLDAEQRTYR